MISITEHIFSLRILITEYIFLCLLITEHFLCESQLSLPTRPKKHRIDLVSHVSTLEHSGMEHLGQHLG